MNQKDINQVVSIEVADDYALICLNNPPVNAASQPLRQGLQDAMAFCTAQSDIKAIAIYGSGRTFVAGADIKEFGKPPQAPFLPELVNTIEQSSTPVISILHGTALGGGLEIALGTHARVGITGLRLGLPEIHLGLLPGAGGTQRTPRLAGIPAALEMILSGRHIPADEALELGLIDQLGEGEARDVAINAAQDVVAGRLKTRRTDQISVKPNHAHLDEIEAKLLATKAHLFSPHKCVEAVRASSLPILEGLKVERQAFMECMDTPQRAGLIHAFFGERAVSNIPEAKGPTRDIAKIGIIGGGTMGSGIATACLLSGLSVRLLETAQENLDRGLATITKNLKGAVKRGKLSQDKFDMVLSNLDGSLEISNFADVDLVIEAAFEDMAIKKEIFTKLDAVCKQGAVLASNTSYLDINEIAAMTARPEDVIGLHFFSPAHVMKLLEIVVADKTASDVVATGFALAKKLRKIGVKAGVCDGFIGNRILSYYSKTASYLVLEGASPEQVDKALERFGFAMGPHKVGDLAGLDIGWMTRKRKAATRSKQDLYAGDVADRICENGWFGRKTGQGYYLYDSSDIRPNPEVGNIIDATRTKLGITPKSFTENEIVDRYMTAMISEAVRVLEDKIAARPVDVDMVFLFGYGFPRHRGGPLHYADEIGAEKLIERIEAYAKDDDHYWKVPNLLRDMAAKGKKFADLNR
ncbi:3-hydroxyacyl-CoA dehydrogenase NAD-binding domain-containing protein [Rhodobacteraceae bacterium]|nr:3-hydroxyacyl-CoA dehydrogenase NAD-binding domain-containing protein [Paracoccaceae bacterium]